MKVKLPIAAKASQKMPLRNTHVGSTDFFRPFINYYLETVPKDKIRANIKQFVQAYPLAGANLGQYKHNMYGFYVPYRTVMRDFNDFVVHNEVEYYGLYDSLVNTRQIQVGYRPSTPIVTRTDLFFAIMGFQPTNDVYTQDLAWFHHDMQSSTISVFEDIDAQSRDAFITDMQQFLFQWGIQVSQDSFSYQGETFSGNPLFTNFITLTSQDMQRIVNNTQQPYSSEDESLNALKTRFDIIGQLQVTNNNPWDTFYICVNLTPYGRYIYQLLESIGYVVTFGGYFKFVAGEGSTTIGGLVADYYSEQTAQGTSVTGGRLNYTALPLMSLYKVFIDWFVPTKFRNRYDIMMQELYKFQYPFRPYVESGRGYLPFPLIREVLLYTSYQSDYFTDAYLYPNGSNTGEASDIILPDITFPSTNAIVPNSVNQKPVSGSVPSNTPYLASQGNETRYPGALTSYALRALNSLSNFVRRNQIVGYKTIDRYLAHYGVKLDPAQSYRSILIGSHIEDVIPLNVMSQSDTTSSEDATPETQQSLLGGRASNLIFSHNSKFEYDSADEFGMFFVISTLTPKIGYVDGLDRMILHTTYDSFYQPDFDSLGVQPIIKGELFNRWHYGTDRGNEVFGFTQRYADYKYKQDKLTGDFIFPSRNAFLDSLHTFRRFVSEPDSINNKFLIGDNAEYDRIFVMTTDEYDHFQTVSYNDVTAYRHCDSNEDVNDIKDNGRGTIIVHEGGNNLLH